MSEYELWVNMNREGGDTHRQTLRQLYRHINSMTQHGLVKQISLTGDTESLNVCG